MTTDPDRAICSVCRQEFPINRLNSWYEIRPSISRLIAVDVPGWDATCHICRDDLMVYRQRLLNGLLADEEGELGEMEARVATALAKGELLTPDTLEEPEASRFGERMADRVAKWGGSWGFIFAFLGVIVLWMIVNTAGLLHQPFDPYPYILLNLVLSCLAAFQAPVIMMSQRRQEAKDRQRSQNDYVVNLKAEIELRQLHEKMDHQMAHQWQRLLEVQQIQIDLLKDLRRQVTEK